MRLGACCSVWACLWLGGSPAALAQNRGLDPQLFRPVAGPTGFFSLDTSDVAPVGTTSFGLFYNYQRDPLVFRQNGVVLERAVSDQQTVNLLWSSAVTSWLQVGVDLPLHLRMDGRGGTVFQPGLSPLDSRAIGDVRFDLKWRLVGDGGEGFGFAIATPFTLPSGRGDSFRGEQDATFSPRLLFDGRGSRVTFTAQLGYLFRRELLYAGQRFGDELLYGAGLGVSLWSDEKAGVKRERVSLAAELFGRASARTPLDAADQAPLEGLLGATVRFPDQNLALTIGGGMGLHKSYGTPTARAFIGLRWTSSAPTAPPAPAPEVKECPAPPAPPPCPKAEPCPAAPACAACPTCARCAACPDAPTCPEQKACPSCPAATPPVYSVRLRYVYFQHDKTTPLDRSRPSLDRLVEVLQKYPSLVVRVEGHTDNTGNATYNKKLSQRRAEGVRTYLLKQGIAAGRVTAVGHGREKAVAPNTTEKGRRENRRVEAHFVGELPPDLRIELDKMEF